MKTMEWACKNNPKPHVNETQL